MSADRGFFVVALEAPKNAINIGSAVRALECYGGSFLVYTGRKHSPRVCSNTFKTDRHYPVMFTGNANLWNFIPYDCVPVAVELSPGARALPDYTHPERAFYIFGPEDGSVSIEDEHWRMGLAVDGNCRCCVDADILFQN